MLKVFQDRLSSLESSGETGTFSGCVSRNGYTIHFSAMDEHVFLGISRIREPGRPVPAKKTVIMKVKSCFSKLVTWLLKKKFLRR